MTERRHNSKTKDKNDKNERYIRLGVNIDHTATLRNARGGIEPDPLQAAFICRDAGCDQITVHLREDRRHITDRDLALIKSTGAFPLNLEMAAVDEIVKIAVKTKPYMATLVPERRAERTTEGGLDVVSSIKTLKKQIAKLKEADILVSLFIEADKKQVEASLNAGCDAIEIHTGRYAACFETGDYNTEIARITAASELAHSMGLLINAGHGLNYFNTRHICEIKYIQELNIGHSIISRSIFYGLYEAVASMKTIIKNSADGRIYQKTNGKIN